MVRVIGEDGSQIGVMTVSDAMRMARDQELDLVEVAPTARPPVCRVMDYGRYQYEQSKRLRKARQKAHQAQLKEVKMSPKIEENDFQTKVRHAREFLAGRDKVKFSVRFRGREIMHMEFGEALLQRAIVALQDVAVVESPPRRDCFFEPAVLTGVTPEMTEAHLKLFRTCAYTDGGFVLDAIEGIDTSSFETSMVILKPESFRHRNPLPGNLVDFFARTGMYITGAKMMHMSRERASAFYSLKVPQFREQLKGMVERKARDIVEKARQMARVAVETLGADPKEAFDPKRAIPAVKEAEYLFRRPEQGEPGEVKGPVLKEIFRILAERLDSLEPDESFYAELAEDLKEVNAQAEFNELIRYISGEDPETGRPLQDGPETLCLALLYSGANGLKVIRTRLKELREIYGRNILQNRAHASDPEEDPVREMEILGMPSAPGGETRPCDVERVVSEFYGPG